MEFLVIGMKGSRYSQGSDSSEGLGARGPHPSCGFGLVCLLPVCCARARGPSAHTQSSGLTTLLP